MELLHEGELYELVSKAAKVRGIKDSTFRTWIKRHNIPTRRDEKVDGVVIKSSDADRYEAIGAGRPRKPSDTTSDTKTSDARASDQGGKD